MKQIARMIIGSLMALMVAGPSWAGEFTDVIDAFDKDNGDPFDLNFSFGYERVQRTGKIRRETLELPPKSGDTFAYVDVAKYKHVANILNFQLEIGLFEDVSLRLGLPLILSDVRTLRASTGNQSDWDGTVSMNGNNYMLFSPGLDSPKRSGVDQIDIGAWWGILDQGRDDTKPNWTVFVEGRLAAGKVMKAACTNAGVAGCAGTKGGGVSRAAHDLVIGTRLSRRYFFMEPFFGFGGLISFPKTGGLYEHSINRGELNKMPPIVGNLDFGIEFTAWEQPKQFRKLVITVGGGAKYHSEGRDFSPLFDALGTSKYFTDFVNADLDSSTCDEFGENCTGEPDPETDEQYLTKDHSDLWTGMTDIENYATFYGKLAVAIQPAKYVKFNLGFDFAHESEHFITKTDSCPSGKIIPNPNGNGSTCSTPNLWYRPELDDPGNRFRIEKTFVWSLFLDATAQF